MRVSANLPDILTSRLSIQPIDEVMALYLKPVRFTATQAALKRSFDLIVAVPALIVLLPLMAVIAVAVRSTSSGPVIFRQRRMTKNGRVFTTLKFRTIRSACHLNVDAGRGETVISQQIPRGLQQPRLTPWRAGVNRRA